MKTIWKFPIPMQDEFELNLPYIHRVLLVGLQDGEPMAWIEVDTGSSKNIPFKFFVEGTGHELEPSSTHVGSWIQPPFVWHLYERYD